MKTVMTLLLCVLTLALARESQLPLLQELLEHATMASDSTKTAFNRVSGDSISKLLDRMRDQLDKKKGEARQVFEKSEARRLKAKKRAQTELAEADSELKKVIKTNEKTRKADERAHKVAVGLLDEDRKLVKSMEDNLKLLRKYKIPSGKIEKELNAIKDELEKKEDKLEETLRDQNKKRKEMRKLANDALKRERKELKETLESNKRTKALDKKNLDKDLAEIDEELQLIERIEDVLTGEDKLPSEFIVDEKIRFKARNGYLALKNGRMTVSKRADASTVWKASHVVNGIVCLYAVGSKKYLYQSGNSLKSANSCQEGEHFNIVKTQFKGKIGIQSVRNKRYVYGPYEAGRTSYLAKKLEAGEAFVVVKA